MNQSQTENSPQKLLQFTINKREAHIVLFSILFFDQIMKVPNPQWEEFVLGICDKKSGDAFIKIHNVVVDTQDKEFNQSDMRGLLGRLEGIQKWIVENQ